MLSRSAVRDLALVSFALVGGWFLHGVQTPAVQAHVAGEGQENRSGDGLAFQLSGVAPDTALTLWNGTNHTLYVYQGVVMGNSNVNCSFSFHIERAGAPIQRQNCPIGQLFPGR